MMNKIEVINRAMFLKINAGDTAPGWLVLVAINIADRMICIIPLFLIGMWLWGKSQYRSQAIKACLVTLLALGINQVIGIVWSHPRPFMLNFGHTWMNHAADSSFPSDHMTVFTGIGLTLLFGGSVWLAAAILTMGLFVAWARVFLGLHFPLDMVGAVVVAAAAYVVTSPLWQRVGATIIAIAERLYRLVFARLIASGWCRR